MTDQSRSRLPQRSAELPNGSGDGPDGGLNVQSAYDWVRDTARNNPVLVVGGAVAVGALVVMAVTSRKSAPPSGVRAFERRIRRDIASAEKALRKSVDSSGFMSRSPMPARLLQPLSASRRRTAFSSVGPTRLTSCSTVGPLWSS